MVFLLSIHLNVCIVLSAKMCPKSIFLSIYMRMDSLYVRFMLSNAIDPSLSTGLANWLASPTKRTIFLTTIHGRQNCGNFYFEWLCREDDGTGRYQYFPIIIMTIVMITYHNCLYIGETLGWYLFTKFC